MSHPDQAELSQYLAGLFDGDGTVYAGISTADDQSNGYRIKPDLKYEFYVAGLFDAEGHVSARVGPDSTGTDSTIIGYRAEPLVQVGMNTNGLMDVREAFRWMLAQLGIQNPNERTAHRDGQRSMWRLGLTSINDVDTFLRAIRPHLLLKRRQADIMVEEIIPRLRRGDHLEKRGFLAVMGWRDLMNTHKGGTRGKYDLAYFEDLWGMELELERHGLPPDLRERYAAHKAELEADDA